MQMKMILIFITTSTEKSSRTIFIIIMKKELQLQKSECKWLVMLIN